MCSCPSRRSRAFAIGQSATLFTDAGGSGLPGTVTFISPKAEFTPRNVQTAEERSKLVYRVRITVDNTHGILKAGHAGRSRDSAEPGLLTHGRRRSRSTASTKRYGETVAVNERVVQRRTRRDVRPDRSGRRRQDHVDSPAVRPAARRRRAGPRARPGSGREHRAITATVGYLSQRFSLYGDLSIDENIAFFAEIHGVRDYQARRDRLLEMTQLTPFRDRLADQLSGGMKQKLALACTLVHEPESSCSTSPPPASIRCRAASSGSCCRSSSPPGITIVMATPYLDEAERCTRVAHARSRPAARARRARIGCAPSLTGTLLEVVVPDPRAALDALRARDRRGERAGVRRSPARVVGRHAMQRPRCASVSAGRGRRPVSRRRACVPSCRRSKTSSFQS